MAIDRVYLGDVGTKIKLDAGCSISDATSVTMKFRKPSGEVGEWEGDIDEDDDNYGSYVTQSGDLDEEGQWEIQLYIVTPSWKGHGDSAIFHVYRPVDVE